MNGFYNIIKPIGFSSSYLVVKLKKMLWKMLGTKVKVGHLGTLDPMASGVLGVAVGSATKLFDYFLAKTKVYVASCVLGKMTDTLDVAGNVIEEKPFLGVDEEEIKTVLSKFVGTISQIPPAFSAKSIDGVRSYRLAAKGISVSLKPCDITVYNIRYLGMKTNNSFEFEVECSGGTYIRSLCRDIGEALGYPAYMGSLLRTRNGIMTIDESCTIEDIERDPQKGFTSLENFGNNLNRIGFSGDYAKMLNNGVKLRTGVGDGYVSVYLQDNFYGIGRVDNSELTMIAREHAII